MFLMAAPQLHSPLSSASKKGQLHPRSRYAIRVELQRRDASRILSYRTLPSNKRDTTASSELDSHPHDNNQSYYWRASDSNMTSSKGGDIGPSSALAISVATAATAATASNSTSSSSSDTDSATSVNSVKEDTGSEYEQQQHQWDLYSLLLQVQATETALIGG